MAQMALAGTLLFYGRIDLYMDDDLSVLDHVPDIEDVVPSERSNGIERPEFKTDPCSGRIEDPAQQGAIGLDIAPDEPLRFAQRFSRIQSGLDGV
jgi:hypothetical protein